MPPRRRQLSEAPRRHPRPSGDEDRRLLRARAVVRLLRRQRPGPSRTGRALHFRRPGSAHRGEVQLRPRRAAEADRPLLAGRDPSTGSSPSFDPADLQKPQPPREAVQPHR